MKGEVNLTALSQVPGEDKVVEIAPQGVRVDFEAGLFRDRETGETRVELRIPNFELIDLPADLPELIRSFGWVMADLGFKAGLFPPEAWHDCCEIIWTVEDALGQS